MTAQWHFNQPKPGDKNREPVLGEFSLPMRSLAVKQAHGQAKPDRTVRRHSHEICERFFISYHPLINGASFRKL